MRLRGLAEIVLMVADVQRSLHFYRDVLGLSVISPPEMKGPVFLQVGDSIDGVPQQIVLVPRPSDAPEPALDRRHRSLHHLGLIVSSTQFETERGRLEGLGFQLRTGQHPFLEVQAIYLDDPDGNEVEIVAKT
jgi:catechol 2,3-dioxygenase-like lactoylglutathione lyase family enzyme